MSDTLLEFNVWPGGLGRPHIFSDKPQNDAALGVVEYSFRDFANLGCVAEKCGGLSFSFHGALFQCCRSKYATAARRAVVKKEQRLPRWVASSRWLC
jgi:hypothetical protein